MSLEVFLNFDGNCRDALDFYVKVFNLQMPDQIMTYDQNPQGNFGEENKGRILYATLPICGSNVMFSDCPAGSHFVKGTNIALTIGTTDESEITRIYNALAEDGMVLMPLGKTFFSELYGMVTDKLGITWQISKSQI